MNKVIIIGNLTRDPEKHTTTGGTNKCSFTVAVQRKHANPQGVKEADFFPVVAWRQLADSCAKYLTKGRKVCVAGSLQTRSYDAQDGTKRTVFEVVAEDVEFLPGGEKQAQNAPQSDSQMTPAQAFGNKLEVTDDPELPF